MTRSRLDDNSAESRSITELVLGEHTLMLAFAALVLFGVFFVYTYYGRSRPSAGARLPALPGIAAVAGEDGTIQSLVSQRHVNSRGPIRIGIIAGHMDSDSGAVCDDGLQEATVVRGIADRVISLLGQRGIDAELLAEFDTRLNPSYDAQAVVSLHADSCTGPGAALSGFKSAASITDLSPILQSCIEQNYQRVTQLAYNENTITEHMREYHVFNKLPPTVPAVILETGFLGLDRELLTTNAEIPASAIADGIVCFVENAQ